MARKVSAGLLVFVAWSLAFISSAGPTRVPADPWLTAAAVAAALALIPVVVQRGRWARWAVPIALLVITVISCQIHLRHGFPRTHDGRLHLWSLWSLHRCVLDGDLFPRWNPYMGLGYPLLQFYPPTSYLAAQPLMALGMSPVRAAATLVVIFSWLSGLSTYWSARRLDLGRVPALAAGAAMILAPYHLFDANFRFALAELAAFALVPPFLVLGRDVVWRRGGRVPWLAFTATAAALLLTHLLSALMAGLCLGIWVLAELALGRWREARAAGRGLLRTAAACLLAAALVAAFLVPALVETRHIAIERFLPSADRPLSSAAIELPDLVERYGWTRYSAKRTRLPEGEDPNHAIPFYFGLALLGAAMAAVVLSVGGPSSPASRSDGPPSERSPGRSAPIPPALAGALFVVLICCLLFSAGIPAPLLDHLPGLRALQFPWRFLGPAAVSAALLAGVAIHLAARSAKAQAALAAVLLISLVADAWPYLGACDWHDPYTGASHQHRLENTEEGATYADRHDPTDALLPADRFIRVELLRFPPSDWTYRVAQSHQSHREYMTDEVFENYIVAAARPPDRALSEEHGVSRRFRAARRRALKYTPDPLASLHQPDGSVVPLRDLDIRPDRLTVALPSDHGGGRLRVLFQAFPGWIVRADDGPWTSADSDHGLLATSVPACVREVDLRFSHRTPARIAGWVVSFAAWMWVFGIWGIHRFNRSS